MRWWMRAIFLPNILLFTIIWGGSSKGDRKFPAVINHKIFRKIFEKRLEIPQETIARGGPNSQALAKGADPSITTLIT